uniref:Peptidase S1 domain-containing protein n=1 Tax=Glossina brevipalpis TaxID=37001 RepID=A0A1A9WVT1_9MUSC
MDLGKYLYTLQNYKAEIVESKTVRLIQFFTPTIVNCNNLLQSRTFAESNKANLIITKYIVSLQITRIEKLDETFGLYHICAGSIVTPKIIVTAATCTGMHGPQHDEVISVTIYISSIKDCNSLYGLTLKKSICVTAETLHGFGTCIGDSGAPLICEVL